MDDRQEKDEQNTQDENFAEPIESYSPGCHDDLHVGDQIRTRIIAIEGDLVFVDTGTKTDGVVNKSDLVDEQGEFRFNQGDTVELYVTSVSESEIHLSGTMTGTGSLDELREAWQSGIPVEGKVLEQIKGGFVVDLRQKRAFCPISQIDTVFVTESSSYVGQTYQFLIVKFEERGRNIVLSRRTLVERENIERREQFFKQLAPGLELEGRVTRLAPFGAFVELVPGVEGMIHISEISWSRADTLEQALHTNEIVRVKVISVNSGKTKDQLRIALSLKQMSTDPWTTVSERVFAGDRLQGMVTNTADFGIFVEVEPGVEGLVHISEISYNRGQVKPDEIVHKGDSVVVMVKDIDAAHRRLSLSMKDTSADPWLDAADRFPVGSILKGTIEKKEKFGWFVTIEPGITGLIPLSKLREHHQESLLQGIQPGTSLQLTIMDIDTHTRKITLLPTETTTEKDWKSYIDDSASSTAGLGILGAKLKAALEQKNRL